MNPFRNFVKRRTFEQSSTDNSAAMVNNSDPTKKSQQQQQQQQQHQLITSMFGNVLDTMDRFLEKEDNLIVQALVRIQEHTNISKRYLARIMIILVVGYLIFSYSFLNNIALILMLLYPSYRSYLKLKYSEPTKHELIQLVKFWIFMSFFTIADFLIGSWIPLGFFLKGIILVQIVIPQNPQAVDFAYENIVKPIYDNLETNHQLQHLNQYFRHVENTIENEHNE